MVDLTLKPSLASYPFRTQPEEMPPVASLHVAEDGGDALLAMIGSQVDLASSKFRRSDHRQAMQILQRSYRIVENYTESFPIADPVPPVALLAAATIRLSLCVVLSSMGRHKQALDEAKMAAVEMDKLWRVLYLGSAEQEEATADGDTSRPHPSLRGALRNPPQWVEKAVEAAVQARQCVAIEIEYEAKAKATKARQCKSRSPFLELTQEARIESGEQVPGQEVMQAASKIESGEQMASEEGTQEAQVDYDQEQAPEPEEEMPDPVPVSETLSVQEQIGKLHRESVQLARDLLPAGHHVRHRAELALDEWLQRTGGDGQPNLPLCDSGAARPVSRRQKAPSAKLVSQFQPSSSSQAPPLDSSISVSRLSETELPSMLRMKAASRLPPSEAWPVASKQSVTSTASVGRFPQGDSVSTALPGSMSVATFLSEPSYTPALGGDVYIASLPKHSELPKLKKKKKKPPSSETSRNMSKQSRMASKQAESGRDCKQAVSRQGSKERASIMLDGPPIREIKTPQQKAKEAAILLEKKDPFEHWRRNMVNETHLSNFQRQLKSIEGQQSLQADLKSEAKMFKCLQLKEMNSDSLYENRMKHSVSGIKIQQQADKKLETFKSTNWIMTEEAKLRNTNTQLKSSALAEYYHTDRSLQQQNLSSLSELLEKSQTYGANLNKLATQVQGQQLEERRQKTTVGREVSGKAKAKVEERQMATAFLQDLCQT